MPAPGGGSTPKPRKSKGSDTAQVDDVLSVEADSVFVDPNEATDALPLSPAERASAFRASRRPASANLYSLLPEDDQPPLGGAPVPEELAQIQSMPVRFDAKGRAQGATPSDPMLLGMEEMRQYTVPVLDPSTGETVAYAPQPKYQPIPTDPLAKEIQANRVAMKIVSGGTSPFDAAAITKEARAIVNMPLAAHVLAPEIQEIVTASEAIVLGQSLLPVDSEIVDEMKLSGASNQAAAQWILDNPDWLEAWTASYYSHVVAAPLQRLEGQEDIMGSDTDRVTNMTADLFAKHGHNLDPDLQNFIFNLGTFVPDPRAIAQSKGVTQRDPDDMAWWSPSILVGAFLAQTGIYGYGTYTPRELGAQFSTNVEILTKAGETGRGFVQDPLASILAEMNVALDDKPPVTIQEKGAFVQHFTMRAFSVVDEYAATDSGIMAGLNVLDTVSRGVTSNALNEWIFRSADPDSFISKEQLTWGQNVATLGGMSPNDAGWSVMSGALDAGLAFTPIDTINLIAGVGNGMRLANRVPRIVSKADTFREAARFGRMSSYANQPIWNHGPISRFSYAAFSRTADDMLDGRGFTRLSKKLAAGQDEATIIALVPDWAKADKSGKVIRTLAHVTDTPEQVKQFVRAAMHNPDLLGVDAPLLMQHTAQGLRRSVSARMSRVQEWLDDGNSLQGLGNHDEVLAIGRVQDAAPIVDEGVTARMERVGPRLANSPEVSSAVVDGATVTVNKAGDSFAVFVDGQFAGAAERVMSSNPNIAVSVGFRGRGVGTAMLDAMSPEQLQGLAQADSLTQSVRGMLTKYADSKGITLDMTPITESPILRASQIDGDGTAKVAITGVDGSPSMHQINPHELANALDGVGLTEDAVRVMDGGNLSSLSEAGQKYVADGYIESAKGAKFGLYDGEIVVTQRGQASLWRGQDGAGKVGDADAALIGPTKPFATTADDLAESFAEMAEARIGYADMRTKMEPTVWVIADITEPMNHWTKGLRRSLTNNSTKSWVREARRRGHTMTNVHPGNIPMVDTFSGGRMLRNWIKFLGGNDDLAKKWENAFRKGNVGTRKQIIIDAMSETGDQIGDPLLREGLIQFAEKQTHETYSIGSHGQDLGRLSNGKVRPVTVTHLQTAFAMPNYRSVAESVRRYRTGKRMPNFMTRGFADAVMPDAAFRRLPKSVQNVLGTRRTRTAIKERIAAKLRKDGVLIGEGGVTQDDLLAMAYADVLGGVHGRAAGHGVMSKGMKLVGRAYAGFHNTFTVAQLAGRPISWTSRVLIEENMRASMFGMPSLWGNPYDFGRQVWETHGIRKLPQRLQEQSRAIDEVVNSVFKLKGDALLTELRRAVPGWDDLVKQSKIDPSNRLKMRGLFADLVSKELSGVIGETAGSVSNLGWRNVRRTSRISKTYQSMARDGMTDQFRMNVDASEILQRSVYQSLMTEIESSVHTIEWRLGNMSKKQQQTHGHGWGRQMFQMYRDPIVGRYGLKRWLAKLANEDTAWNAEKLTGSRDWANLRHIVDEILDDKGITGLDDVAKAEWYLTNIVDDLNQTLYKPLLGQATDPKEFLRALKTGEIDVEFNGIRRTLSFKENNYQGFVDTMEEVAQDAYAANVQLPTVAAYFDPRYGQHNVKGAAARARAATDWIMEVAGERPTQALHRQPTFKHIHGKWYRYLTDQGWSEEAARAAATEKAAELTNFIFFDNKNIPGFLKTMNRYVPFFSAMFEVGSTWLYKIPTVDTMPAGYLHLARRVDRVIRGLRHTGLLRTDPESGDMTMMFTDKGDFGRDPVSRTFSAGMYKLMAFPGRIMENLMVWEDPAAWNKDGFSIAIGNPLDPTSTGLMAVNQFSAGPTPILAWPAAIAAEAAFKLNDTSIESEGMTAAEFVEQNPEVAFEEVYQHNQEAINALNPQELIARVLDRDFPLEELAMPDNVVIPGTSLWETMADRLFFPFGKYEGPGAVAYSVVPSSLSHVVRGALLKAGMDDDAFAEFFIGSTAQASITGEVLNQLQMEEFKSGAIGRIGDAIERADAMLEAAGLEAKTNEDGSRSVLNPSDNESAANQIQEIWSWIEAETERVLIEANNNAAGSMLVRGITGWLSPSTPRQWDRQQEQMATYWEARDIAEEARETGRFDYSQVTNIKNVQDLVRVRELVASFWSDPSGRDAKVWMKENYPGMEMYLQGKSYWAGSGMPVYVKGFEGWIEQMQSGDREAFPPEVFLMRHWRSGVSLDKEIAIRGEFGDDPVTAAGQILADPERYNTIVDDYNAKFESYDFIDQHMFGGAYDAWRSEDLGDLSVLEVLIERDYVASESRKAIEAALDRSGLDPRQRRTLLGQLNSALFAESQILRAMEEAQGDPSDYRTKRDQLLDQYRENVTAPYYEAVDEVTAPLDDAYSSAEERLVWEDLRDLEDEWYFQNYYITDEATGISVEVPSPMVRTWNAKSQGERQQRLLYMVENNPEWLSQFDISIMSNASPAAQLFLPVQTEVRDKYKWTTDRKAARHAEWVVQRDVTPSALDGELSAMDEEMDEWLVENGYGSQVEYKDATPFARLDLLNLLPRSLQSAMPVYRQVIAELDAIDKSPRTNAGTTAMSKFTRWLEAEYFTKNPAAEDDLHSLSFAMFGTKTPTTVYARMFQGEDFGDLYPVAGNS